MGKERRLGRGLEALLGTPIAAQPTVEITTDTSSSAAPANGTLRVSVYDIQANPYQPRREFDEAEIDQLSTSLQQHGLLQPILVRCVDERYQLIAGERRLRAAIKAGWPDVPVQVVDADDRKTAEIAIVENLQRKDLNALEKAASFQRYLETYGCTQEELAGRLQLDRSTIANLIRLLELPDAVQHSLRTGDISPGHARALLPLANEQQQVAFCGRIVAEGLSVRAIEDIVQQSVHGDDSAPSESVGQSGKTKRRRSANLNSLEQDLRKALGAKVDVRQGAKGRGKIVIHFSSSEEYERLHAWLCGDTRGLGSQAA